MMKRTLPYLALAALGALASSCSPGGDVDPGSDRFLIYDLNAETDDYQLSRVTIDTLNDVRAADGDVVYLRGGGSLATPVTDPQTREEWERILEIEDDITPQIEYTVDADGTVVPWDFDSAMMLTVYHHYEAAYDYFNALPLDNALREDIGSDVGDRVGRMPCYYYPSIRVLGLPIPIFVDNAAFAFTLNAFIIPPRQTLVDAVPIYANRGVITHEYSHAVFNRLVYNGVRVPDPVFEEWDATDQNGVPADQTQFTAANEIGGLDEGIADIFGALDTKDPNYIAASISERLIDRDLAKPRFYEACLFAAVQDGVYPDPAECGGDYPALTTSETGETTTSGPSPGTDSQGVRFDYAEGDSYDTHHLGAVAASVVWSLREQHRDVLDDDEIGRVVVKSLRDIQEPTEDFRITQFFDALHQNLPDGIKPDACALFQERLIVIRDELQCSAP